MSLVQLILYDCRGKEQRSVMKGVWCQELALYFRYLFSCTSFLELFRVSQVTQRQIFGIFDTDHFTDALPANQPCQNADGKRLPTPSPKKGCQTLLAETKATTVKILIISLGNIT